MSKAMGYVRVSTAGQAIDGVSIDAQRARIEAWCQANGCTLAGVHIDSGLSGKRADNRPALQLALSEVCNVPGAVLVVYSLSRLARSTKDAIGIAERLNKSGADLVSLSEKIDTTSATGKLVFRMLAVLAEFERDLIAERTVTALTQKASRGQRVGTVPFGWSLGPDQVTLEVDPNEQQIISEVRDMRATGMTLRAIADELTRRGVPTKQVAVRWSHSAVIRLLNPRIRKSAA